MNNAILFTKESYDKMMAEVPKFKMITVSILSDRLRINCSLARRALAVLIVRLPAQQPRALGFGRLPPAARRRSPAHAAARPRDCAACARGEPRGGRGRAAPHTRERGCRPSLGCSLSLQEKGLVREVVRHGAQYIYTRATNT